MACRINYRDIGFQLYITQAVIPYKLLIILAIVGVLFFGQTPLCADPVIGEQLFKGKNCALCHDITLPGTEFKPTCPGLKDVRERHGKEWLQKWLRDPGAVWETDDEGVQDIKTRYFKFRGAKPGPKESLMATVIGKIIKLSPEEIEHLIDYLHTL